MSQCLLAGLENREEEARFRDDFIHLIFISTLRAVDPFKSKEIKNKLFLLILVILSWMILPVFGQFVGLYSFVFVFCKFATMERNSINVIIFDEEEPSLKEHPPSRTNISTSQPLAKSHHLDIIEQELSYLNDRVKHLEQQSESLSQARDNNSSLCKQSNTSIDIATSHGQDIALAV